MVHPLFRSLPTLPITRNFMEGCTGSALGMAQGSRSSLSVQHAGNISETFSTNWSISTLMRETTERISPKTNRQRNVITDMDRFRCLQECESEKVCDHF